MHSTLNIFVQVTLAIQQTMWYYEVILVRFKNSSGLVTNNGIIDLWQVRTRRDLWNNKHYTREVT